MDSRTVTYQDNGNDSITYWLWLEGDAYDAPAVLEKQGSGDWTLLNVGRDSQGSITHVASISGTLLNEYSYDPWGRLRDPETQEIYAIASAPTPRLGSRGYTAHEHLPSAFGLVNMNARLYDPLTARFLAPDPFVSAPDFSQAFNRYAYCVNNPLKYTDESGETCNRIINSKLSFVYYY